MPFVPNEEKVEEISFVIKGRVEGDRIDQYLAKRFSDYSRVFFQKLIKKGKVLIDGKETKISAKIKAGDQIVVFLPKLEAVHLKPENTPLDVIYEDDVLALINKPVGVVIHPSRGHMSGTIVNALLSHFDDLADNTDVYRPGIVHRLDRDTSGILLIAKTNSAQFKLSQQFEHREIKKEYLALAEGNIEYNSGIIQLPLGMDPRNRERMSIQYGGKSAITEYKIITRYPGFTLVHVFPKTGRTHQIRVHFKSQGHPLACDHLYDAIPQLTWNALKIPEDKKKEWTGDIEKPLLERQALHAWRISFDHPLTNQRMTFQAPLAPDFFHTLEVFQYFWPCQEVAKMLCPKEENL
jgi:23S rRNA pseudouridine1911/1915/1917 synthase